MKILDRFLIWLQLIACLILFIIYNSAVKIDDFKSYQIHTTLYLDRTFNEEQKISIIEAAFNWSKATNNMISYDIISLPANIKNINKSIIVVNVTQDYPEIITLDILNRTNTVGYYSSSGYIKSIWLVSDRLSTSSYKQVMLHELGHSLGIDHNEGISGINTIMYTTIDLMSDSITNTDLDKFCKIYKCKLKN